VTTAPLAPPAAPAPAPAPELDEEMIRPWLDPLVYQQEKTGYALLQTDFRPCVALFTRFTGIDYQADTAADQLNQFIRPLQAILAHYGGTLIDLTFGDKGSYTYINFGALSIHEDDARRAVKTALRLREVAQTLPFLQPLQIGITSGVMHAGAYGGATRRHYGALADEVNMAARLMSTAAGGEILVSEAVYHAAQSDFLFEPQPPLRLKGKSDPITPYRLTAAQPARPPLLHEPAYALPMVGRGAELAAIAQKLDLAAAGASQIVSLVGEAGLGKSRLAAEVLRLAHGRGFASYGGACQADGLNTPYLVWKQIWSSFFDVDPHQPPSAQIQRLREQALRYAPQREAALPLLGRLLDLPLPENRWTEQLAPKNRQTALHALLEDCLKQACAASPLFILIEDLHWIDALSHDLLAEMAQSCAAYPIFFLLAYRPTELPPRLQAPRLEARPNFTPLYLAALNEAEARQMIQAKLAQLYPTRENEFSPILVQKLLTRTEGNPFYLEEALNFLHGRGLDPRAAASWETDLPDSLHALILSRLDQLKPSQRRVMRVASIIGRLFPVSWLIGYYPALGELSQLQADLTALHNLDLTLLDRTEPELAYLFKHIITHEVTYESLPFAARADLHERLAAYLERLYAAAAPLETLAFHYGRSANSAKQIEYLRRAGEAAQRNFANDAALDFYGKLLPLLALSGVEGFKEEKEKFEIYLQRGQVLELLGKFDEAESDYRAALQFAKDDPALTARSQLALGKLMHLRGDYAPALEWLGRAQARRAGLEDKAGLAQVLNETGAVWWHKGEHGQARATLHKALALAREAGDKLNAAQALNILGLAAWAQGDYAAARAMYEESLSLRREMGDKKGVAASLGNLGLVIADGQGDYATARAMHEECLSLFREIGDKQGVAGSLNNLGNAVRTQGDYATARTLYEESLSLFREMGDKRGVAFALNNLGVVLMAQGDAATARPLYEESLSLKREMGDRMGVANSLGNLGDVALAQGDAATARALYEEGLALSKEMADKSNEAVALLGLGLVDLAENKPEARENILGSLRLRLEMGAQREQTSSLVGMAGLRVAAGDAAGAAQILGAVASALKALGAEVEPAALHFHTQTVAAARAQLGEAAFQQAWAEGAQWTLAAATAYALEETFPGPSPHTLRRRNY
jgi:predicted ATPase/class 3 adenylate cyclase